VFDSEKSFVINVADIESINTSVPDQYWRFDMKLWLGILLCGLVLAGCGGKDDVNQSGPPKVIIDSDYNTLSDDGQLGVMAAQLMAQGLIDVKGITVVSGNHWSKQEISDALKSVERLGVEKKIGIYAGANYALSHDYSMIQKELQMYPGGDGYLGAWLSPEPTSPRRQTTCRVI
jgi:purine nucleosidase